MISPEFEGEVRAYLTETSQRMESAIAKVMSEFKIKFDERLVTLLRSSLSQCNSFVTVYDSDKKDSTYKKLTKRHEEWKEIALNDPLTSDLVKQFIRENTFSKKIYQSNSLTTELAKRFGPSINYLKVKSGFKKKNAILFSVEVLFNFFSNNPEITSIELDAFTKAVDRTLK
jgi:hypothetical protein